MKPKYVTSIIIIFVIVILAIIYLYTQFSKTDKNFITSEQSLNFEIQLNYVWGLGSRQININNLSEISDVNEVEGGYIDKRSRVPDDDIISLIDLIKTNNVFQIENRKEWATYRDGTHTLTIKLDDNGNQISCDKSKCPPEVISIINEIEALSNSVFERSCLSNVNCSDISCKSGSVFFEKVDEYSAQCKKVSGQNNKCSC